MTPNELYLLPETMIEKRTEANNFKIPKSLKDCIERVSKKKNWTKTSVQVYALSIGLKYLDDDQLNLFTKSYQLNKWKKTVHKLK